MHEPQLSHRTAWEFRENAVMHLVRSMRADGKEIHDWTVSNPTLCGFPYDTESIARGLTDPSIFTYAPDPAGRAAARELLAGFLVAQLPGVRPERLLLTAGSSEAYSFLFRLLCNSGENVLVPKPGYPLCDELARLNDVELRTYRYYYSGSWHLDEQSVREAITTDTRAIIVIHPNNPTGNFLTPDEQNFIGQIACEHGLAIIADEVFYTFPFASDEMPVSCSQIDAPLVFALNGLSKLAGLPQMKLGWMSVHGAGRLVQDVMQRLEMIADTYLSVNTPVQVALSEVLHSIDVTGNAIRARVAKNYALLRRFAEGSVMSVLEAGAGWNALVQLPRVMTDEEWTMRLLEESGVLVYPGHFFDMVMEGCIAVSLLPEESRFAEYCAKLRAVVDARVGAV
jgi:alanine-synthesizing transaminase